MKVLGLDLNATTAWAVHGALNQRPKEVTLDSSGRGLPMILNIKARRPRVGFAGLNICRSEPQQVYANFFGNLSRTAPRERSWWVMRPKWDSHKATEVVLRHLKQMSPNFDGSALTLPGYFTDDQVDAVEELAKKVKFPIWGTISAPLAASLYAYSQSAWSPSILVVDVDDRAMTIGIVDAVHGNAQVRQIRVWENLSWRKWVQHAINGLAEVSIVQNRKDPRVNSAADQSLFDQIGAIFKQANGAQPYNIEVRAEQWYFQLNLLPRHAVQFCAPLLNDAIGEIRSAWFNNTDLSVDKILLTHRAGRLPGLADCLGRAALRWMDEGSEPSSDSGVILPEDFGSCLMKEEPTDHVMVLPPEALALGSHLFASLVQQGVLSTGRYENQVKLFLPQQISA